MLSKLNYKFKPKPNIFIPLNLWFSKQNSLSLPLIELQLDRFVKVIESGSSNEI
jgi:hypothetical protein